MTLPRVTIGLPTFNRAPSLYTSISLILNQTFKDFELLIYDDGSSDSTIEIVESFSDNRISFYNFPNQGPPFPLNFILDHANGEYIIFLHDHDYFSEDLIEKCVNALDKDKTSGFVLPGGITIPENKEMIQNPELLPNELNYKNSGKFFLLKTFTQRKSFESKFHACSMVRRTALDKVGKYYNTKYGFYSDVELWLRLLHDFDFIYLHEPLIQFTTREKDHVLTGKEIEVLNNLFSIHFDTIHECFYEDQDFYINILKKKYFTEAFWLIANLSSYKDTNIDGLIKKIPKKNIDGKLRLFLLGLFKLRIIRIVSNAIKRAIKFISKN